MKSRNKILVVDDDSLTRQCFTGHLEKHSFEVDEAENWRITLRKLPEFNPDIVLLDVGMPELNGDALIGTIKTWRSDVEVVMVTSDHSRELKNLCLSKGAFAVMRKPVELSELHATIISALGMLRHKRNGTGAQRIAHRLAC